MATIREQHSTGNINTNVDLMVRDVDEKVFHLEPSATPLTRLLTMVKSNIRTVHNPKFEVLRQEVLPRRLVLGASYTTGTTLTFVSTDGLTAGSVIKNVTTNEVMLVTSVVSATSAVVDRAVGTTAQANSTGSDDSFIRLGTAYGEGTASPDPNNRPLDTDYNYTQIFKKTWSVSNTLKASRTYGGDQLKMLRGDAGIEFALDIEHDFLFGERGISGSSTANPKRFTRGLIPTLSTNLYNAAGSLSESNFNTLFLENVFRYGNKQKKIILASARLCSVFDYWGRSKLQIDDQMSTKLGVKVMTYLSSHGDLKIIKHHLLEGSVYSGYGVVIDPEYLRMAVLEGRNTKMMTNIQAPDLDGTKEQYICEAGLDVMQEKVHGLIYGITGAA